MHALVPLWRGRPKGGGGTLLGPFVGAVLLYFIEEVGRAVIQQGYYILPALMLIVVFVFMPNGIVGMVSEWNLVSRFRERMKSLKGR